MIRELNKEIDRLDDSLLAHNEPRKEDVIGLVKIAMSVLLVVLKALEPITFKEKRKVKLRRWITWIETGTVITTLIKPN